MKKSYSVFGILAPVFYLLAVVIGGALTKGYSHTYNAISEITASNLNVPPITQILFASYNISLILFGIGAYLYLKTVQRRKIKIASVMLIIVGLLGIGMYFFPQDPRHMEMTFGMGMHLTLASLASLLTMLAIIFAGAGFKGDNVLKGFRVYSFITCAIVFITGGIAAASIANDASFGGVFERFTIGAFMQWVFVISLNLFLNNRKEKVKGIAESAQV